MLMMAGREIDRPVDRSDGLQRRSFLVTAVEGITERRT
jgi:hypothetical protein